MNVSAKHAAFVVDFHGIPTDLWKRWGKIWSFSSVEKYGKNFL